MKINLFILFFCFILSSCDLTRNPSYYNTNISNNLEEVSFDSIPSWDKDDVRYALQAFRNTCKAKIQYSGKIIPDEFLLKEKCRNLPSASSSLKTVRKWFEDNFQPYKIYDENNNDKGVFTGYYSPIINACRYKTNTCNEPILGLPNKDINYKGISKRKIVENKIGKILYWANIVDVQNLQIQGSGMLKLENGKIIKLNFAGVNDMPFKSIGAQLQSRGIRPNGGYSSDSVWKYLKQNPSIAKEVIYNNPRYVYFKEVESHSVIGKMGIPLSKIRSIALDDSIYTLGLPVYINTKISDGRNFRKLMIAQDTGGAIRGWIRGDIFFGVGDTAYKYAHNQHEKGEMYIFIPK